MTCVDCDKTIPSPTPDPFRCLSCRVSQMTFKQLDAASIRTGCESELNRLADLELRRRGYEFSPSEQRWLRSAQ